VPAARTRGAALLLMLAAVAASPDARQHGRLFPPHELGLLEGPDRDAWQEPDRVMDALGIGEGSHVADIGAGGGWFTIRLSVRVGPNGLVYAEDIQPQMIEAIDRRVKRENRRNVKLVPGTPLDPKLPPGKLDAALIVEAYNEMEQPVVLLRNVARALKALPQGRLGIIEHKKDGFGPGPPMEERVAPERIIRDAEQAGLRLVSHETFLRYQYMLVFGKPSSAK
jgi:ubiquinone/menaquinone biosynthesis C-methylase UbiE